MDCFHAVTGAFRGSAAMVLPHELFAALYHHHREAFFTHIVPGTDAIQNFWKATAGSQAPHIQSTSSGQYEQ